MCGSWRTLLDIFSNNESVVWTALQIIMLCTLICEILAIEIVCKRPGDGVVPICPTIQCSRSSEDSHIKKVCLSQPTRCQGLPIIVTSNTS